MLEKLLAEDQIDIAITLSNPRVAPRLKLERVHLERVAYYAALSRRHPLAGREAISLDELTELPIIFPDPDAMGSMYQNFCCALEARERGIPENLHYVDIPSLVFQIESTNGASLVFEIHRERYRDLIACLPVTGLKQVSYIAVEWKAQTEERLAGDWPERLKGIPGAVS